ncbi:glycerate kinase [Serinibacter salmoneus]|uniref:Glycerate kinase n=1 Tax=Serinibacter salmoneus TaxID=556530 RepID=A0A2A9D295_9MICO|nr:glycerate kinase [Serinibacter salmoneus]PFG20794.1 glycerate kinase [Serinibacter salmoneus]
MRVVVAMDSFKGSLSAEQACEAVRTGVLAADSAAQVVLAPMADGGEGTVAAIVAARGGRTLLEPAVDAIGRETMAAWGLLPGGTAVLEAAATLGLADQHADSALPARASSAGLGGQLEQVRASGARRVLVGLGGSACTDGGTGMLLALGARLWDASGAQILPRPGHNPLLRRPVRVELPAHLGIEVEVLSDVTSPLLGAHGAARMFGPQKGADPAQVELLEEAMTAWAQALAEAGHAVADLPGAGAAGGLGAALAALGACLVGGIERVAAEVDLPAALVGADLVITGEGRLDAQSALGKVPDGVARLARAAGVARVIALAGAVETGPERVEPFDAVLAIQPGPRPLAEAMRPEAAAADLARVTGQVVRLAR